MTGENLFTHQLPRVSGEAAPILLALYPQLVGAQAAAEQVTAENHADFLANMEQRYGKMLAVPKMGNEQHERIDPFLELADKIHPDKIVVVKA